jgi:probable rRNA maturation factor
MSPSIEIFVENHADTSEIAESQWQEWFSRWIAVAGIDLPAAAGYELTLRLTSDEAIRALNRTYRNIDRPTDVLSFACLEDPVVGFQFPESATLPLYLGDIIISTETAASQADSENLSLATELVWLASHGFLHLLGWDHPDDNSLTQMLSLQAQLLTTIGVLPPQWAITE